MRVLLLAPHPFYQDRGTPIDVDLLVRALTARGETVDLVTYHEGEDRAYPNVTHYRIRAPRWLNNVSPGFSLRKLICDWCMFVLAWKLVRRKRYDLIHAGEEAVFMAMYFKWLYCTPYVYDMDSSIAQQMVEQWSILTPAAKLFDWCEAKAIQQSLAVAPVCKKLQELALKRGSDHVFTVHDISQLESQGAQIGGSIRDALSIKGLLVMYVGNLEAYQGIDLLLESFAVAIKSFPSLSLLVAGGSKRQIRRYESKAEALGIVNRTRFIGSWPAAKLHELLVEADILAAPRIRGLNTPQKTFPYLHSGKPLLATDLPTHSQILDSRIAMLARPNPSAFAEAMVTLAKDRVLRARLGEAGRQFVERDHTFPAHQQRVNRLYDFIAGRCQRQGRGQT